jgi:hypothetical protein
MIKKWEELTDLEQGAVIYSDFYKDAYGIRPVGQLGHPTTVEEYEKEIDRLSEVTKEQVKEEAKREEEAWKEWKEFIDSFMLKHDVSQSTAIKWDMEAQEVLDDVEHYCYLSQLSFDRESEIKALL